MSQFLDCHDIRGCMATQFILAGILMIGVLIYLVYTLLYPEKF